MSTPFDRAMSSVPVTVVTSGAVKDRQPADVAVLRLEPTRHTHAPDEACEACAAVDDVRAQLFDLLQQVRTGVRPEFTGVLIDAHRLTDPRTVIARLGPDAPARGLRDHTVARSFHLSRVI